MSKVCKNCGAPMMPDAVKCRCCGGLAADVAVEKSVPARGPAPAAPIAQRNFATPPASFTPPAHRAPAAPVVTPAPSAPPARQKCGSDPVFCCANWQGVWNEKRRGANKLGIILTDTKNVENVHTFTQALNSYMDYKAGEGVEYCLLDLKDQQVYPISYPDVESVVELLRTVYEVSVPDYLMIVGDSTVIPSADWYNECDDGDETVPSDLPYITLDTQSPWEGVAYDFENITQVGRIPAKPENGFAEAIDYFTHTKQFGGYPMARSFAYSALVWEATSRVEFAHLNPMLITSPQYTSDAGTARASGLALLGKLSGDFNLVCFNLHGSDGSHVWYGQEGGSYPEAFEKGLLPDNQGYVLCTEACYGARSVASASIVVHALRNRCVAFVGSSRIAYGMSNGGLSCADVIAHNFTKGVANGLTVGKAFLDALSAISEGYMDEEEIKTLAEFALYGDPSAALVVGSAKKAFGGAPVKRSATRKDQSLRVSLMSCNEESFGRTSKNVVTLFSFSEEEQAHIKLMANQVSTTGNDYILEKFSSMGQIQPRVYKVVGKEEYRAVYSKNENNVKSVVKMHMDGAGNVKKVYHSK